jgi:hypothetical protein
MNAGASVFEGLDDSENAVGQSWQITKNSIYFNIRDDIGVLSYRYWLATNKHEYQKMITFFNAQNRNKLVKEATKILLPDVPVN